MQKAGRLYLNKDGIVACKRREEDEVLYKYNAIVLLEDWSRQEGRSAEIKTQSRGGARSGVDDGLGHTLGPIPPIKPKGSSRSRRTIKAILKFSRRHSRVLSWLRLVNDIEQNPGRQARRGKNKDGKEEKRDKQKETKSGWTEL